MALKPRRYASPSTGLTATPFSSAKQALCRFLHEGRMSTGTPRKEREISVRENPCTARPTHTPRALGEKV